MHQFLDVGGFAASGPGCGMGTKLRYCDFAVVPLMPIHAMVIITEANSICFYEHDHHPGGVNCLD